MKGQLSGMRGVYLTAAELSRLGFIASPTSRSALAADILVTDQACQRAFSVQVKTNSTAAIFWLVGKHTPVSDTHVYVLVNLQSKEGPAPEYFIVPSGVVKERTVYSKHPKSEFYSLYRNDILDYKDKWDVFGDPRAELQIEEQNVSDEIKASGGSADPEYRRNDDLRGRINVFLKSAFLLPEDDYYGRLNPTNLLALKAALSDINNALTMQLTLGFLDLVARSLRIDAAAIAEIRASVMRTKPSTNGYDIFYMGPVPFVAEVKCNIPVNGGTRYGAAQRNGILKDISALLKGKSKGPTVTQEFLKFMVFLDLPEVRAANASLLASNAGISRDLRFLEGSEVPSNPAVVHGVYALLGV